MIDNFSIIWSYLSWNFIEGILKKTQTLHAANEMTSMSYVEEGLDIMGKRIFAPSDDLFERVMALEFEGVNER